MLQCVLFVMVMGDNYRFVEEGVVCGLAHHLKAR